MVYAIYFSPTGTSRRNAISVAAALGGDFKEVDITVLASASLPKVTKEDVVVFSFPVYGSRILAAALNAISDFVGDNTPCIAIVTYGNRVYGDALCELATFVKNRGFIPFAAAALIGQHTYGEIAVGRPNVEDLKETSNFFAAYKEKLVSGEISQLKDFVNFESETKGKGGRFYPLTSDACVNCGLCKRNCPVDAIKSEDFSVDNEKCIACFRCVKHCPVGAKNMDVPFYIEFAKDFSEKLSTPLKNEYFGN